MQRRRGGDSEADGTGRTKPPQALETEKRSREAAGMRPSAAPKVTRHRGFGGSGAPPFGPGSLPCPEPLQRWAAWH